VHILPARRKKESKSHVGTDTKSNITRFKYTIVIEVSPICKHDLVLLSNKLQNSLFGGRSNLVLCDQVTSSLKFIDPSTKDAAVLVKDFFDIQPLQTTRDLREFIVLDVELLERGCGQASHKQNDDSENSANKTDNYILAEVEVARAEDFGLNDNRFIATSHLGRFLQSGDSVLGYDLTQNNFPDELLAPLRGTELPDVVLVKKKRVKSRKKEKKENVGANDKLSENKTTPLSEHDKPRNLGGETDMVDFPS